ncbi:hypothetical protein [Nonomuraea sp. NPDC002799]
MSVQDLREVLRERAEAPSPANPYRHEEVRARVRGVRRRRSVTAAVTAAAVVMTGVALLTVTDGPAPRKTTTVAAQPVAGLPERFTSADGTAYRRIATATLKADGAQKTSIKIPVTGRPLDVAARCHSDKGGDRPSVTVDGKETDGPGFMPCLRQDMELRPLIVSGNATEVTVGFDATTGGCLMDKKSGSCLPSRARRADWSLAVYEWAPPAQQVVPQPVKDFRERLGDMKLAGSTSGVWDDDSSFSLSVTSPGGKIGFEQLCTGDLAARLWFTYEIGGKHQNSTGSCVVWEGGPYPKGMITFSVPKGKRVTVSGRIGLWGESGNRPVRWSLGVYTR